MNKLTINPNDFIIKDIQEHRFYISKYHFREYSTSIKEFTEDEIKDGYIPVEFTSDLDISQDFTHITNTTINAITFSEQFGTKKLSTTYINKSIDLPTDETIDEILTRHKYETDNDIKNGPFGYDDYYSYKVPTNTTCNFLSLKNDISKLIDNENKKVDNETTTNFQLESYIQLSTDKVIRKLTEINNDNNRKVIEVLSDFYKDLKNDIATNKDHILTNRSLITDMMKTVSNINLYIQGDTFNEKISKNISIDVSGIESSIEDVKRAIVRINNTSVNTSSIMNKLSYIETDLSIIKKYTHDTVCRVNTKL